MQVAAVAAVSGIGRPTKLRGSPAFYPNFIGLALSLDHPTSTEIFVPGDRRRTIALNDTVSRHLDDWRRIGASDWVLDALQNGIFLPWPRHPPRFRAAGYPIEEADKSWLREELERELDAGIYRELSPKDSARARCIVPAFLVRSAAKPRMEIHYRVPTTFLAPL